MENTEMLTVGGGCFWCTEAVFQQVNGVLKVVSGYSGGTVPGKPTYREVCSGLTGHAEVVQVSFNPTVVSYADLLLIFMTTHDPTSLNKQGADVGTEYRSVIFYHSNEQQQIANELIQRLKPYYNSPIVTELSPLKSFYAAETYHQNYYNTNSSQPYCTFVIDPKLKKLRSLYADKLKKI